MRFSIATTALAILFGAHFATADPVATVGLCANVDVGAQVGGTGGALLTTALGTICLCEQAGVLTGPSAATLNTRLTSTVAATAISTIGTALGLSTANTIKLLTDDALLSLTNQPQSCNYPANAVATCPASTTCNFVCATGFVRCSGKCYTGTVCPSGTIQNARRRNIIPSQLCSGGKVPCAVGKSGYECVDVSSDVEQCGACANPFMGYQLDMGESEDCTAISPFAGTVSCRSGSCVVESCARGYSLVNNDCVKSTSASAFLLSHAAKLVAQI